MEELSILYETKVWQTAEQKRPPFTSALYANGFSPVIEDPNTNVKIFEVRIQFHYVRSPP